MTVMRLAKVGAGASELQSVKVIGLITVLMNRLQSTGHCSVARSVRVEAAGDRDVLPVWT